jgi:hypothetical protein
MKLNHGSSNYKRRDTELGLDVLSPFNVLLHVEPTWSLWSTKELKRVWISTGPPGMSINLIFRNNETISFQDFK